MSAVLKQDRAERNRRRVLVVDDHEDGAASVAGLLEVVGCIVRIWPRADGVPEQIAAFKPDVVFLDLDFGRGPELDLLKEVCGQKERPVVAILTGWVREADRESVTEAGCDHFVVKGDDPSLLIDIALNGTRPQ